MTRFTAAENSAAVTAAHVPYRWFAEFDFLSGFVRLNSGDREYTFSSLTFGAVGKLGGIGPVKEGADLSPTKLEFTLSGVDNSLVQTTLTEKYHGRNARLWKGYVNETTDLVATPHLRWEGRMDTMALKVDEGSSSISMICENRLILWNQASGWLYTHEHQGLLSGIATDNFFDQVQSLASKVVKWGGALVTSGANVGGGGGGDTRSRPK